MRFAATRKKDIRAFKSRVHIDEIVESLKVDLSSFEIFVAVFELELAGKVKQLPGKEFCEVFLNGPGNPAIGRTDW
jgi:DNA processing protein